MLCGTSIGTPRGGALITHADRERILRIMQRMQAGQGPRGLDLTALAERLDAAEPVSSFEVPRNVVTLNSRVQLRDIDSGKRSSLTLASPFETSMFGDQLSVAGPAGAALLGRCVGQIVSWKLGPRTRRYRIEEVLYQPEAAGDFHL